MRQLTGIIKEIGINVTQVERVNGGDINQAYCILDNTKKYFLKTNSASAFPNMFAKEANGLKALSANCSLNIPIVIKEGVITDVQYLLLEWIEYGTKQENFWEEFGSSLAQMHKKPQAYFGFEVDNYIGSLHQSNVTTSTPTKSNWAKFYAEERILPLVEKLMTLDKFKKEDRTAAEKLCIKFETLFPKETPSLLHGDLWSGNFMCASNGKAAIYDPAVYYGHREMDIGMTKLFGGFDKKFYEAYNYSYPMEKGWEDRISITQLYPILVHAVLFGGGYIEKSKDIFQKYN